MTEEVQNQEVQNQETVEETEPKPKPKADDVIPRHRFNEVSQRAKEAEKKLQELESQQQQAEEATAQEQGKYQELAQKRQTKVEQLQTKVSELEATIVTGERYRAFSKAANGVLLPEAVDDAFSMLGDDDFSTADTNDENSYRALAQQLAERKPYLSDGVRGAGSGGSSNPIFGANKGSSKPSTNRIAALNSEKKRRSFK